MGGHLTWSLFSLFLHQLVINGRKERALLFQPKTHEIQGSRCVKFISQTFYFRWATACAAETPSQEAFVQSKSLEMKSLFVKSVEEPWEIEQGFFDFHICGSPFQISAAYHRTQKDLQFGYDIYYDESKFHGFEPSNYKDLITIKQYLSTWDALIQQFVPSNLKLNDATETKLSFIWIPRVHVLHNYENWIPNTIRYQMLRNTEKYPRQCDDYNLAKDYFDTDVNSFYAQENQRDMLNGIDASLYPFLSKCQLERNCLSKWQLIPANQLSFDGTVPRTCSDLTAVPIWTTIAELPLDNLHRFLDAIIRVLDDNLTIVIGTGKWLALPTKTDRDPVPIYLNQAKSKIPIPSILYHLVVYKLPECNDLEKICDYALVIVIHNHLNFNPHDRICPQEEDLCVKYGWDRIQYENIAFSESSKLANIYCCEPTESLVLKIGMSKDEKLQFNIMDLLRFPNSDKKISAKIRNLNESIVDDIKRTSRRKRL